VLGVVDRELGGLGNLVAAGPGSYLDELLDVVGAENALADYRVRYPKLSAEQILRAQPEIILDLAPEAAPERGRDDWKRLPELPAVQHGRVYVLQDGIYLAPGPRIGQAIERLSAIVHGNEPGLKPVID
jgi:iron complex transport system substrate-binding protein